MPAGVHSAHLPGATLLKKGLTTLNLSCSFMSSRPQHPLSHCTMSYALPKSEEAYVWPLSTMLQCVNYMPKQVFQTTATTSRG